MTSKTLVQAFVSCRLEPWTTASLQLCSSASRRDWWTGCTCSRFRTSPPIWYSRRSDHIMQVLRQPHWLQLRQRVDFIRSRRPFIGRCLAWHFAVVPIANERLPMLVCDDSTASRTCVVTRSYCTLALAIEHFGAAGPGLWKSSTACTRKWQIYRTINYGGNDTSLLVGPLRSVIGRTSLIAPFRNNLIYLRSYLDAVIFSAPSLCLRSHLVCVASVVCLPSSVRNISWLNGAS